MTNTSRGPYKKYLVDIVEEIPVTTIRSRRACFSAGREKQRIVEVEVPISDKLSNNENTKNHDIQDNDDSTINIEEYSNQFQDNAIRIDSDNETIVSRRSLGESNSSQADSDFSSENENNLEENYLNYSEDENSDNYNNDNVDIHKNKSDSESNEDNEEYENQIQDIIRVSIYEGCNLTKEESQLLIMGTAIRNKMTDVGLETLLKIVDCHLPHTQYNSKYHFLKTFPKVQANIYYFCPKCLIILKFENCNRVECKNCEKIYNRRRLQRQFNYFYHLPLKEQLIELVNTKLFTYFRKMSYESDVINGNIYYQLREKNIISDQDISIQWNTDGVEIFNLSKYSIWPIQVSINELPYRIRRDNILLCVDYGSILRNHLWNFFLDHL
ncbi:uncharacterized protein [Linepithema humile]|uniref:uncharacterized protein isoform X1 n=1 Tax=Linepithema humile TaxID=83485 RepID=UPI00351DF81A